MKWFIRSAISVTAGCIAGYAFYSCAGNVVYIIRDTTRLATYDPLLVITAILTLPVTAVTALMADSILRRAFKSR